MILATGSFSIRKGSRPRPDGRNAAFSLIEIVLVLALITVASSLVIANFAAMADRGGQYTTEELIREAVKEARFQAASERTITTLRFNKETGSLQIGGERAQEVAFDLHESFGRDGSAAIKFFLVPPSEGLSPYNEAARTRMETDAVRFAPDRSSSPFVVEIDTGDGTPQRLVFDPFSSLIRAQK